MGLQAFIHKAERDRLSKHTRKKRNKRVRKMDRPCEKEGQGEPGPALPGAEGPSSEAEEENKVTRFKKRWLLFL